MGYAPYDYQEVVLGVFLSREEAEEADLGDHDFDSYGIIEREMGKVVSPQDAF